MNKKIINNLFVIFIFGLVGLLVYYQLLSRLDTNILGNTPDVKDGFQHIWNFWWAKKTCLGLCGNFWTTDYLFSPGSTSLLFHNFSFFNMLLFLPLLLLGAKPVLIYNLSFIVAICLSGYFMYLLAKEVTRNHRAALISGLIYSLSPYIIGHLIDGQLDHASIQFFPLWLLFLIKSHTEKNILYPIVAGLLLFVLGTDFSFLVIAIIVWTAWIVHEYIKTKKLMDLLKKSFISSVAFILPFLLFFYGTMAKSELFQLRGDTKLNSGFFSTDLMAYIVPTKNTLLGFINKASFVGIDSDNMMFLGYVAIFLTLIAITTSFKKFTKNGLSFWLLLTIVGLALSIGPQLRIFSQILISEHLPYSMIEKIPIANILRTPSRFAVVTFVGVSVLSAFGYILIEKKLNKINKYMLFSIIFVAILIETFPYKLKINEIYLPNVYKTIASDHGNFAILEYPTLWANGLEFKSNFNPETMYYQTEHEKKIAGGYLTRVENKTLTTHLSNKLLNYVFTEEIKANLNEDHLILIEKYKINNFEEIMQDNDFKYLVINKNLMPEKSYNKILSDLQSYLDFIEEDQGFVLYKFRQY